MVEPIGGYSAYPVFSGAGSAAKTAASSYPVAGEVTQASNASSGIAAFFTGNHDTRKPEEKVENQKGPIGGFFGGLWNGLTNTIKNLFTPDGLLMVGGFLALNFLTGGALTPIMFVLGGTIGTYQVGKGLATGDWEKMGQGAFTLGTTFLGAKFDFFTMKHKPSGEKFAMSLSTANKEGVATASKTMPGIADNFKLTAGAKMPGTMNSQKNIYQVGWDNARFRINGWTGKSPPPPAAPSGSASATSSGTAVNPFAQSDVVKPTGST